MHNGCVQAATRRMRDALYDAGSGRIIYYLDAGNPTNVMKLYNPRLHHVAKLDECIAKSPAQLSWRWATELDGAATQPGKGPHMIKSIFVRQSAWVFSVCCLPHIVSVLGADFYRPDITL